MYQKDNSTYAEFLVGLHLQGLLRIVINIQFSSSDFHFIQVHCVYNRPETLSTFTHYKYKTRSDI